MKQTLDFIKTNIVKVIVTLAFLPLILHWGLFGMLVIGMPIILWWCE
jgi:hypothetical protein